MRKREREKKGREGGKERWEGEGEKNTHFSWMPVFGLQDLSSYNSGFILLQTKILL